MKSNKHQTPVDEYFRQREADIPVTYNPDDWAQLAAALDAAAKLPPVPGTPAPPPPQARRFRGVKGWWVAGLFLLLLTSAWVAWEQGLPGRPAAISPAAATPAPGSTTGAAPEQAPAPAPAPVPVLETPSKGPAPALALPPATGPAAAATAPGAGPNEPEAALPRVDTLSTSVAPQDTTKVKPVQKKKKNLFW